MSRLGLFAYPFLGVLAYQ